MYAISASTAGVSLLAMAQPAEAKIVYTPAHVVLTTVYPHTSYNLDLNHDGINDFRLVASSQAGQSSSAAFLTCFPAIRADKILATSIPFGYVAALRADVTVGPGRPFLYNAVSMGLVGYAPGYPPSFRGPWVNHGKGVKNRYLGFKFVIKGKIHYGWARLSVAVKSSGGVSLTATLTGYAYETIPGKSIRAGQTFDILPPTSSLANPIPDTTQPASLGMLALGAKGVPLWRRKETVLVGD
jgi:hypothetical protein